MRVIELLHFARERHRVYERKEKGLPKPWTKDPILQTYRFSNIYRELDKTTVWIRENWRDPHADDPNLWLAMSVARFFNVPEVLDDMGYPLPWQGKTRERVLRRLHAREEQGKQVWSGVYMISGQPGGNKVDLIARGLDAMWEDRVRIQKQIQSGGTLKELYHFLLPYRGFGSFISAQVIADLKHVEPLLSASDWFSWAASGTGSRRGLWRVARGDETPTKGANTWRGAVAIWESEEEWFRVFHELHEKIVRRGRAAQFGLPEVPHGQDLQGWLCEYDKYCRVKLGEGRPRSLYPGV